MLGFYFGFKTGISIFTQRYFRNRKITGIMDGKSRGIVAYITLIGWIVAIATNNPKDKFASFHIRQMLGLVLTGVAIWIANFVLIFIPIIGWLAMLGLGIGLIVFWVMGLVSAINGEEKPLPIIGPLFQDWFKTL